MNNRTYTENFIVNMNDFKTSVEFSNHLCNFLSKFAYDKSITYPNIIHVGLNNGIYNVSYLFVYPFIDNNISYEIFLKERTTNNKNKLFIKISYTI